MKAHTQLCTLPFVSSLHKHIWYTLSINRVMTRSTHEVMSGASSLHDFRSHVFYGTTEGIRSVGLQDTTIYVIKLHATTFMCIIEYLKEGMLVCLHSYNYRQWSLSMVNRTALITPRVPAVCALPFHAAGTPCWGQSLWARCGHPSPAGCSLTWYHGRWSPAGTHKESSVNNGYTTTTTTTTPPTTTPTTTYVEISWPTLQKEWESTRNLFEVDRKFR